jgi:hypothetical protein
VSASVIADAEVVELLRDSPDLLAIADAIASTQERPRRRLRAGLIRLAAVAAVVVIAGVVALASPWDGRGGGFVERALAALGDGQVIHLVSVSEVPGRTILDLQTGAEMPLTAETEIWFDSKRGLERVTTRMAGAVTMDELQTPDGAWTEDGRVYTCAWIAAHPVEATKARVSCNASGDNGTTPRRIAEPRPVLDPALAGFVGGYKDALASGGATRDGSGVVNGRMVEWLKFERQDSPPAGEPAQTIVERVAVDEQTLKPVLVQTLIDGKPSMQSEISTIDTLSPQSADFTKPRLTLPSESPVATSVTGEKAVSQAAAAAALDGRLLLNGGALDGLPLSRLTLQQIVTGYGANSGVPPTHSYGIEAVYGGPTNWDSPADYVVLKESVRPEMLYRFSAPYQAPVEDNMFVSKIESSQVGIAHPTIWMGQLVKSGIYVTVEATSKTLLVDAARALAEAK